MRLLKSSLITAAVIAASAVSAVPAFAHAGPHEAPLLATILHWFTSPTHAGLVVVGSAAIVALIIKLNRSRS